MPERHRGRGVGSALLRALSSHVQTLGKDGIHCDTREHDAYSAAFLEHRGFVEVGRTPLLGVELARAGAADPELPDGVELSWLAVRPDLLDGMDAVAAATYPEIGGHIAKEAGTLREWQLCELGDPLVQFDMTPIAMAGDRVVGFATMVGLPDGATAAHRITAVIPDWRRQRIGTALTHAQLTAARKAGLRMLTVWQRTELVRRHHQRLGYQARRSASTSAVRS